MKAISYNTAKELVKKPSGKKCPLVGAVLSVVEVSFDDGISWESLEQVEDLPACYPAIHSERDHIILRTTAD